MGLVTTYFFACVALFIVFALLRPMADAEDDGDFSYAGFWQRFGAMTIDGVIVGWIVICYVAILMIDQRNFDFDQVASQLGLRDMIGPYLIIFLYSVIFESSELKATPGKLAMGICVVDTAGNRIVLGQAIVRQLYHIFSYATFYMGFALAGVTRQKQALHDVMAQTYVIEKPVSKSATKSMKRQTLDRTRAFYASARHAVQPRRYDPRF